jgi:hypothetical protein
MTKFDIDVIPEPGCGCFEDENTRNHALSRVIGVAATTSNIMFKLCMEQSLCLSASKLVMHELILSCMTIFMSEEAPAIELGSQEALWESERHIAGIEKRLLDGLRVKYQMYNDLTPEKQKDSREFFGRMAEGVNDLLRRRKH